MLSHIAFTLNQFLTLLKIVYNKTLDWLINWIRNFVLYTNDLSKLSNNLIIYYLNDLNKFVNYALIIQH